MFGNTHMDSYHHYHGCFGKGHRLHFRWKEGNIFVGRSRQHYHSQWKEGRVQPWLFRCEFPTGLDIFLWIPWRCCGVVWNVSGGSKIPPGYCSVPWQEVFIRDSKVMFVAVLIDIVLQPQQSLQLRISGEDINFSYPSRPQGEPFEMEV